MTHAKILPMLCQMDRWSKLIEFFFSARTEAAKMKGVEFLMNRNGVDLLQHDTEEDGGEGWHEILMEELR